MTDTSLLRRALVGLTILAASIVLGVVLAAGGDQGTRRPPDRHLTATSTLNDGRIRRHAADVVAPRLNPRAPKPRTTGSRPKSL